MNDAPIDLRSDTVTHPTSAMRRAMSTAEVGDDVYGEDPTVNRLEERAAELMGRPAGLLVPTGTMGNQIAIHVHSTPGSEAVAEANAHVFQFEMGAMAALSGVLPRPVETDDGILSAPRVAAAIQPAAGYRTRTSLVVLENSHNLAGGRITPPEAMREIVDVVHERGLPVHLDGARIHNASAALGLTAAELSAGCDSVMFCLSKGLGAPVGSMLVGDEAFIAEARRVRKMFGGGMRQAGVLAAAGLVALDDVLPLLAEDNRRARNLAGRLAAIEAIDLDPETVETNIVFFGLSPAAAMDAGELATALAERGVLCHPLGGDSIRMVTHYHIDDADIERAAEITARVLNGSS